MKADAVIETFRRFLEGDNNGATSIMRQISASELNAGRSSISKRIDRLVNGRSNFIVLPNAPSEVSCIRPDRPLSSIVLPEDAEADIRRVIDEWERKELLREHGLQPRGVLLLSGPSGNGKTSLAQAIATELQLPFAMVSYTETVNSYLGETAKSVARAMDFARKTPCVLMFDEADSIVSSRLFSADGVGREGNRVVNHVLMELDNSLCNSMVVFATNMADELDSALVRRLAIHLDLGPPDSRSRHLMVEKLSARWPFIADGEWLAKVPLATSFAKIEQLAMDAARAHVLALRA